MSCDSSLILRSRGRALKVRVDEDPKYEHQISFYKFNLVSKLTLNVSHSFIIETAFGGTLAPVLSLEWLSFRLV